ncbi:MAG: toll/interleukin-1 receptor domain-containing protein [Anaerolineae bacterium]|nr:toll/interleukin-1 receptor domain-containing protein [Anaerolineae bacterium]
MSSSFEDTFRTAHPAQQAYEIARAALIYLGAQIQQENPAQLMLVAAAAMSAVSFGEYVTIGIRPFDATACDVWVRSELAAPGAIFDYGKNQQNVLAVQQAFMMVATQAAAVQPPPAPPPAAQPDPFELLMRAAATQPETPAPAKAGHHLFISYRRSDSNEAVGRIYDRLVRDLGADSVFKDVDNIPLGVDFVEYLDEQVKNSTGLLAVIGPTWLTVTDDQSWRRLEDPNDFVRIEIASALRQGIPVVPVLVRGAAIPRALDLPEDLQKLARRNGISVRADPDFHNDMTALIRKLAQ